MRKIISLIIFIILISTTCAYTEQCNFELVKKSEVVYRERFTIDSSKFLIDDNWSEYETQNDIEFGNGIYIQTGIIYDRAVPYQKIPAGTTNSPLYIR